MRGDVPGRPTDIAAAAAAAWTRGGLPVQREQGRFIGRGQPYTNPPAGGLIPVAETRRVPVVKRAVNSEPAVVFGGTTDLPPMLTANAGKQPANKRREEDRGSTSPDPSLTDRGAPGNAPAEPAVQLTVDVEQAVDPGVPHDPREAPGIDKEHGRGKNAKGGDVAEEGQLTDSTARVTDAPQNEEELDSAARRQLQQQIDRYLTAHPGGKAPVISQDPNISTDQARRIGGLVDRGWLPSEAYHVGPAYFDTGVTLEDIRSWREMLGDGLLNVKADELAMYEAQLSRKPGSVIHIGEARPFSRRLVQEWIANTGAEIEDDYSRRLFRMLDGVVADNPGNVSIRFEQPGAASETAAEDQREEFVITERDERLLRARHVEGLPVLSSETQEKNERIIRRKKMVVDLDDPDLLGVIPVSSQFATFSAHGVVVSESQDGMVPFYRKDALKASLEEPKEGEEAGDPLYMRLVNQARDIARKEALFLELGLPRNLDADETFRDLAHAIIKNDSEQDAFLAANGIDPEAVIEAQNTDEVDQAWGTLIGVYGPLPDGVSLTDEPVQSLPSAVIGLDNIGSFGPLGEADEQALNMEYGLTNEDFSEFPFVAGDQEVPFIKHSRTRHVPRPSRRAGVEVVRESQKSSVIVIPPDELDKVTLHWPELSRSPSPEALFGAYTHAIKDGLIKEGDFLPGDQEIMEKYGLSLHDVKELMVLLHRRGAILSRADGVSRVYLGTQMANDRERLNYLKENVLGPDAVILDDIYPQKMLHGNWCGYTSVSMGLQYQGLDFEQTDVFSAVPPGIGQRANNRGTRIYPSLQHFGRWAQDEFGDIIRTELYTPEKYELIKRRLGLHPDTANGDVAFTILNSLIINKKTPAIIRKPGHTMLVVGVDRGKRLDQNRYILFDPVDGPRLIGFNQLDAEWGAPEADADDREGHQQQYLMLALRKREGQS